MSEKFMCQNCGKSQPTKDRIIAEKGKEVRKFLACSGCNIPVDSEFHETAWIVNQCKPILSQ